MTKLGSDAVNALEQLGAVAPQDPTTAEITPVLRVPFHLRNTGVTMELRSSAPGQDMHGVPTGEV